MNAEFRFRLKFGGDSGVEGGVGEGRAASDPRQREDERN